MLPIDSANAGDSTGTKACSERGSTIETGPLQMSYYEIVSGLYVHGMIEHLTRSMSVRTRKEGGHRSLNLYMHEGENLQTALHLYSLF